MPLMKITPLASLRFVTFTLGLLGYLLIANVSYAETKGEDISQDFTEFLKTYQKALKEKSSDSVKKFIKLPIKVQYIDYDMESKVKQKTFSSVSQVLKNQEYFLLPEEFLAKLATTPLKDIHVGDQKCEPENQKANDVVDYTVGTQALTQQGKELTLTLLAEPCAAETHIKTVVLRTNKLGIQVTRILSKKLSDYQQGH